MTDGTLDVEVIAELQDMMGADFVKDLVDTFFEEAPQMIADLRVAAAQGDADVFRRAAHSLKSDANTFGAQALAENARTLEMNGASAQPEDELALLESEFAKAQSALKALLNE